MIKYTVLRLALFVVSLTVLWAVGVRQSLLMLILAALISLALSYLLLARQREEFAQAISERVGRRLGSDAESEDAAVSEHQADREQHGVDEG
jgi:Protein of unknown function (DUF4229)